MLERLFEHLIQWKSGSAQASEASRQSVAGILGAVCFLVLYFALDFFWLVAFGLSVAIYFGFLKVLEPTPGALEDMSPTKSESDLDVAAAALKGLGTRLRNASNNAPGTLNTAIADMSEDVLTIRQILLESPTDFRSVKSFINVFLPRIVETVETYVRLSERTSGAAAERLDMLSENIAGFSPTIGRIKAACLESDLRSLEVEVAVLSERFPENE